jgi:hypothetical protein
VSSASNNAPNQRPGPVTASDRFDYDLFADYNPPSPEERIAIHKTAEVKAPAVPLGIRPPHPSGAAPNAQHSGRQPYTGPAAQQTGANPAYFHNPAHTPGGPQ